MHRALGVTRQVAARRAALRLASGEAVAQQKRRFGGKALLALSAVAVGGAGYSMRLSQNKSLKKEDVSMTDEVRALSLDELRRNGVVIYRYLTCPFCGKVKAFLDLHKIPYTCVEVDPLFKSQMKGLGYSKVPFMKVKTDSGKELTMADSYDIVSLFSEKISDQKQWLEDGPAKEWREWGSEKFIRYLTLNLNRSLGDAYNSSCYIDVAEEIPAANKFLSKVFGSITMYLIVQHFVTKPKLMKMGYDGGDARQALYAQVDHWIDQGVGRNKFFGGAKPSLVDTDVYGILNAIRGLPLYNDVMQNTKAREWVHRMDDACGNPRIEA